MRWRQGKTGRRLSALVGFLLCAVLCLLLCSCGETVQEEVLPEETPVPVLEYRVPYRLRVKTLNEGKEAVLFQQAEENGFLAIVNRKTGEEIPPELAEEDIPRDGRYDVYENQIIRYLNQGGQESPESYRMMDPPPYAEGTQSFISENRLLAVRSMEDGRLITVEASYERWLERDTEPAFHSRDGRTLRVLSADGEEQSAVPIELDTDGEGFDTANLVYLGNGLLALPRRTSVLVFDLDGREAFHVTTPYPVGELQKTGDGNLAVLLQNGNEQWLSTIQVEARTVSVPFPVPADAHLFCAGEEDGTMLFVRNTELFSLRLSDGSVRRLASLLDMGIDPTSIAAMFCGKGGQMHFLIHEWQRDYKTVRELHVTAIPQDTVKEGVSLQLGFTEISTAMKEAVLRFNRGQSAARIACLDYRNLDTTPLGENKPDMMILDGEEARRLSNEGKLAVLADANQEKEILGESLIPAVRNALSDSGGNLTRIAGIFRVESMACDENAARNFAVTDMEGLRQAYQALPAGGKLYEPWYTRERLLQDLLQVNGHIRGHEIAENDPLYGELDAFAALQPAVYDHSRFADDRDSVEKRIYDGRELMMAAHIGSMLEFKWADSFFPNGAVFVGWPTEQGMASLLFFDETLGVSASCEGEKLEAARSFLPYLVEESYTEACTYGFPASEAQMEKLLRDDMAAISYRMDEKGKFVLNKKGEKIERARSNWYTPEWRQHFEYALTEAQYHKLMDLIAGSV